jgi:hypothetical protein
MRLAVQARMPFVGKMAVSPSSAFSRVLLPAPVLPTTTTVMPGRTHWAVSAASSLRRSATMAGGAHWSFRPRMAANRRALHCMAPTHETSASMRAATARASSASRASCAASYASALVLLPAAAAGGGALDGPATPWWRGAEGPPPAAAAAAAGAAAAPAAGPPAAAAAPAGAAGAAAGGADRAPAAAAPAGAAAAGAGGAAGPPAPTAAAVSPRLSAWMREYSLRRTPNLSMPSTDSVEQAREAIRARAHRVPSQFCIWGGAAHSTHRAPLR